MEFYENFDLYMNNLGISNYKMSMDTGISDSLIGYWRNGKRKPSLDNLIVISNYLKLSIDSLVYGSDTLHSEDSSILLGDNESENELLETYRKLDRRGQHRVHTVIYEEIDRMEQVVKSNQNVI